MSSRILAIATLPLLAIACAPVERATDADSAAGAPAVTVVGEAQRCIMRDRVRQTLVRTDRVIDFEMQSGPVYRSTLPGRCPGLNLDQGIIYETSINQLCSNQIVYSLENIGGVPRRGAGCSLGAFVPVEYVKE
ncbi:MAG TPA: hypothetical protein VLA50_00105 [Erythrobacter sp.]|nr:hypothetical protein [Erythrobacter sp.]